MYVVRTHTVRLPSGTYYSSDFLMEMTKQELREAEAALTPGDGLEYNIVSAEMARRYVKQGMTHGTPLWVDFDGKVRYARDPGP